MSLVDAKGGRISLRDILDASKSRGEVFSGIRVRGDLIRPERAAEFLHLVGYVGTHYLFIDAKI